MKLDFNSVIPLYYQLKEILQEMIKDGTLDTGKELPSERRLMETFGVSRATVRQAMGELTRAGLVVRRQGRGTFVAEPKIVQDLLGEPSFVRQSQEQGLHPSSTLINTKNDAAIPRRVKKILQLAEENTLQVMRLRSVNGEPIVLETLYIPTFLAPDLQNENLEELAIIEYLCIHCSLSITSSTTFIEPVLTSEYESKILGVEIGMPALLLERTFYSDELPVAFQKRVVRGDRSRFMLTFRKDSPPEKALRINFEV